MEVSILLPCLNEINTLPSVLSKLSKLSFAGNAEVIAVDDGSCDDTFHFLNSNKFSYPFKMICAKHSASLGKGAALSTALGLSKGKIIMIQDADCEYDPSDLERFYEKVKYGGYDAVFGSRLLSGDNDVYSAFYFWGNKIMTFLINILFSGKLTDSYTGRKVFKRECAQSVFPESEGFEAEAEMCCRLLNKKFHYCEIPISYSPRSRKEGKKIKFSDSVKGFLKIVELRLKL